MRYSRIFDGLGREVLERIANEAFVALGMLEQLEAARAKHPLQEEDFAITQTLAKAQSDRHEMEKTLTIAQARCTELLLELRELKLKGAAA